MEPSIAPAMDRRPSTPFSTESSCIRDSPDQEFRLRWNNYQANLAQVFDQLLQTESFVDVTLTTDEGQSLKCHKVVLSACSPYFQQLFMENPCQHPIGNLSSAFKMGCVNVLQIFLVLLSDFLAIQCFTSTVSAYAKYFSRYDMC